MENGGCDKQWVQCELSVLFITFPKYPPVVVLLLIGGGGYKLYGDWGEMPEKG